MDKLKLVRDLIRSGLFREALETLESSGTGRAGDVLRAELFERVGRHEESKSLIERLRRSNLEPADRGTCEFLLGQIAWETAGDTEAAVGHVQRAIVLARGADAPTSCCLFHLRLFVMMADKSGPNAVGPMLAQLRTAVTRMGDPLLSAALHIFVGETDAKRGLRQSSERHTRLGLQLLGSDDNLWLRAVAENILAANCIMASDIDTGILCADRALALAERSGAAAMRRACLSNLGTLHYLAGDFEEAIAYLERGKAALPSVGERSNSVYESLARVYVTLDRVEAAKRCHSLIEASIRTQADWSLYGNRHSRLGLSEILVRERHFDAAEACIDHAGELAASAGDHLLATSALLTKANILRCQGQTDAFLSTLRSLIDQLPNHPPELFAQYERVLGAALVSTGLLEAGGTHFDRARRWYAGLHNVPGLMEVERTFAEASAAAPEPTSLPDVPSAFTERRTPNLLQNVATLLMQAGRPELLATGIVAVLADTGAVASAKALSRTNEGPAETLASYAASPATDAPLEGAPTTIKIGTARGRSVDVVLQPHADVESAATLNAVTLLLSAIRDLERAHAEREDQLALWPIEEPPLEGDPAIIGGCLHELLSFARRVALTNVSVLITGESGTGKEILARAIHGYSTRADKPFVPFNCTAVPREMLESLLFGYRRGAFTGADRDSPGLVRAARTGTLFLDEVGEMSIDLQPKLLRFLESGEISPLGESPSVVDVRVVAATNRNLEQLVSEGRFREDLYYRLNVIRLSIPPLRERRDEIPALVHHFVQRTSTEFAKGRVRVAEDTLEHLVLYAWPGNIRQLQNEIRRMVALADTDAVLKPGSLSPEIRRATARPAPRRDGQDMTVSLTDKLPPTIAAIERAMIRLALNAHPGQVEAAAKALGISRKGLYLKRQRLGL